MIDVVAATGHRPNKLGGYGREAQDRLFALALRYVRHNQFERGVSGMALGWDQAFAKAVIACGIPLIAAIPFAGQESQWPEESQSAYRWILERAAHVVIVQPGGYSPAKMQIRNQWMVDNANLMLALWDGSAGGTANCVRYAESKQKPIVNLWSEYAPPDS